MNNSFLNNFTPKEPKFFPILKDMAHTILKASELLVESVQKVDHDHESSLEYFKKIKEQEKIGDELSVRIFNELNSTFITPFDREDINNLASRLDDVTDFINSCAKKIVLYQPKQFPKNLLELALNLNEAAQYIIKAVDELDVLKKNSKKIKEYCSYLHVLENKADDLYDNFLIDLFEKEKDAVEIIKMKEIMAELERGNDAAEFVGKIIKTIIIKYA
jgi:hypothetical protein